MSPDKNNRNQYRQQHTDLRHFPTTPVEGGTKHGTPGARRAATTTKATRKNKILSSIVKSHDARRYPSSPDWDSQITLTQLVPTAERLEARGNEDENGLETGPNHIEVIDLVDDSEEDNTSYKSSNRRPFREQSNTRFRSPNNIPTTTFKRRKSSGITPSSSSRKTTKSAKGKHGNKTLTQMDFVRRYIPLPESDDDDLKLYDEILPATNKDDIQTEDKHEYTDDLVTPRKRRKLDDDDDDTSASPMVKTKLSPDQKPEEHLLPNFASAPKTPQRARKFEIPSSQTPESPRLKFSPSPGLRKIRPPSLGAQSNTAEWNQSQDSEGAKENVVQQESLQSKPAALENRDVVDEDFLASTATPNSQFSRPVTENKPLLPESDATKPNFRPPEPPPVPREGRTVVYDTDADTDYGDLDDDLPQPSSETNRPISLTDQTDGSSRCRNTQSVLDSDDLPPVPNSGTDLEINANNFSDSALASESSVYYRRPAQCTQYPNGPVPMMSTQKMAELFPIEEEEKDQEHESRASRVETLMSSPGQTAILSDNQQPEVPCSQGTTPTQGDYIDKSIQIVPESSPITRHDEIRPSASAMAPPSRESIVLVESSQLVDRISRQSESSHVGGSLRRLFSTGQFLTDSVMESIPPPPWALSQDSVGEPYPENDGS